MKAEIISKTVDIEKTLVLDVTQCEVHQARSFLMHITVLLTS